jgi:hypothetical protein
MLLVVAAVGRTGEIMAHAEENQTKPVRLPWTDTEDEVVSNIAIGSLRESLMMWLKTERGIHAETLLASVGALAGFAAQNAALARVATRNIPLPPDTDTMPQEALSQYLRSSGLMMIATAKSGENFYFGDLINGYLVHQATSDAPLWGFVAAAAIGAGVRPAELPDYHAMFRHAAATIGTPEFGVMQVAREHQPQLSPRQALDTFWPRAKFILTRTDGPGPARDRSVRPEHWPLVIALVASQFVTLTKDTLDPGIGLALLMEAAIAMSKVDPKTVPQSVPDKK